MKKSRKEFIMKAHSESCSEWKANIEKEFPKLFKKDGLIVGKWYRRNSELLVWNGGKNTYGFAGNGLWGDGLLFSGDETGPATDKEVETALIKEAKKRGFKEGARYNAIHSDGTINGETKVMNPLVFNAIENSLHEQGWTASIVFINGTWTTITETITKEQAEKELGKTIID